MGPASLDAILGQLTDQEVRVYLPKLDFAYHADMVPTLAKMGMTDAFDRARADFSGLVIGPPVEPPYLAAILRKATIAVDENGTVTSASTVGAMVTGGGPIEPNPPEMRIDRPFISMIRDNDTGTILFLGRVMDPSAA